VSSVLLFSKKERKKNLFISRLKQFKQRFKKKIKKIDQFKTVKRTKGEKTRVNFYFTVGGIRGS
jgi:hypothetical protein